ncbi:MAG: alpha/beta fold hydrolase [Spirochaetaceae bacterium]|nr:MAG: alpha/beta fold hydrolase [Spirochaetaceae bacterium]
MHKIVAVAAAALILVGVAGIVAPRRGLSVREYTVEGMPVRVFVRRDMDSASAPGVVVAHGFAASSRMMTGYAYTLAHAGYAVAVMDFAGHGANRNRLEGGGDRLQADVDAVVDVLIAQPEVDRGRIAIVGHSMGSGAAMTAAIRRPDLFDAVVALSPTGAEVTPDLPRNLLLMAGGWEPRFVANAERLLDQAGGERNTANARALVVIPNVEHIGIVFSARSQTQTREWLDSVFDATGPSFTDRRPLWFVALVVGAIGLALASAPVIRRARPVGAERGAGDLPAVRDDRFVLRGIVGPVVAVAALAAATALTRVSGGAGLANLGGIAVGGALSVWFGVCGVIWLLVGFRPAPPRVASLLLGLGLFGVLFAAVGLAGEQIVFQWMLTAFRALRWPFASLLVLPWCIAAGYAQSGRTAAGRIGVYALVAAPTTVALAIVGLFIPGFFFVVLILPVVPIVIAVMMAIGAAADDPWAYATGTALFFGWLLVAVFPLA